MKIVVSIIMLSVIFQTAGIDARAIQPVAIEDKLEKMTTHEYMLDQDRHFQKLSKKERKQFIRYWIKYYQKKLKYRNSDLPRKAVAISIFETSLGSAGVGKSKKNLFGLKSNHAGKYISNYQQKSYRLGCKALVKYYKRGSRWHLWTNL